MTPPVTAAAPSRTVGDILLGHGYITEEQLAEAVERQVTTGQPLGQILVESGAITRLELASALAEQWSDAPHLVRMDPPARGTPVVPIAAEPPAFELPASDSGAVEELRAHASAFASRLAALEVRASSIAELHERLVEVRQMVSGLADWASGPELRLAELESMVDSFVRPEQLDGVSGRLETAETAISSFGERVEQVIAAIGGAIGQLEDESKTLTASIETLTARVDASATTEQLAEIRALVADVAARPTADPGLTEVVGVLASRLDVLEAGVGALAERAGGAAAAADVEALRGEIGSAATRIAGLEARVEEAAGRADLDGIRAEVGAVAARLEELDARSGTAASGADVAAIRSEVGAVVARVEELATVAETAASRADVDTLRDQLGAASARIDGIEGRLEQTADVAALDEVRARLEELTSRPGVPPEVAERLDDVAVRLETYAAATELAELRAVVEDVASRPAGDPVRLDVLADRVADLTARLDGVAVSADGKVDASVISELRAAIDEVAARPQVDPVLAAEVHEIGARLDGLVSTEALSEARAEVDALAAGLTGLASSSSVEELRSGLETIAGRPAADPALESRLDALVARVDALAVADDGSVDAAVVTELRVRLDELAARPEIDPGLATRVEALAAQVGRLATSPPPTAPAAPAADPRVDAIADRIAALERAPRADAPAVDGSAIAEIAGRVEELSSRIEAVAVAAAAGPAPGGGEAPEGELDKIRVSVESLWMRMAEFQKSVAALLDPRGLSGKIDMLEARLDAVEAGGRGGAGAGLAAADVREISNRIEEMEATASTARETLLIRLEKMASTIDWRLQRLEAPAD